jgi:hypothetical protein
MGPERNVKVDRGTGGGLARVLPVVGDGCPRVLHFSGCPTVSEEYHKAAAKTE